MTDSTTTTRVSYTGDGISVNFPITFPFYLATDILVLLAGTTITSGYSVSGGNGSTGTLTMATPPVAGVNIQGVLNPPLTQTVNLVDGTAFPSATLNQVNDRAVQIGLRLQDQINRAIRAPDGDVSPGLLLPPAAQRLSQYLATDGNGNLITTQALPGTANTQASLGPILNPRTTAEIAAGVTPANYAYAANNVRRYGATGDRVTDDTAAFNAAIAVAAQSKELYIPPLQAGYYYKITSPLTFTNHSSTVIRGQGIQSLIVVATTGSADGIVMSNCNHCTLRDFGIYGTSTSGNNINLTTTSNYNRLSRIWSGWAGIACYKITQGQSNLFTDCIADDNNGYRPATLTGGLLDGAPQYGLWIPSEPSSLNNDNSFVNCQLNAVGTSYNLQVGTSGGVLVETFSWTGGLIQGSFNFQEIYLVTKGARISNAHIEPKSGATANWTVTMDQCVDTVIRDTEVQGDCRFIGGCVQSGYEHVVGTGFDIDTLSDRCFIRDSQYGNITTGPTTGQLKDRGTRTQLNNLLNGNSARFMTGDGGARNTSVYFQNNMQDWVGGGAPTNPCGFDILGAPTVTRDATIFRSGSYSAKIVPGGANQGLAINIEPINEVTGRLVTVEAWCYNLTAGAMSIQSVESGSVVGTQATFQANAWERVLVTFQISSGATAFQINFLNTSGAATFYLGPVKITLEEHTPITQMTMDATATPVISNVVAAEYGGYPVPYLVTNGNPAITNFKKPHVGKPFTLGFAGAVTVNNNASILLNGAVNFTGAANNTLTLVYGPDGIFREISRKT